MGKTTANPRSHDSLISAEENLAMFEHIAGYYDRTNRVLSFGFDKAWRRRAVETLSPIGGRTYLDIGCGTADVSIEILRHSPESRVVGIDPSEAMLTIGRKKVRELRLEEQIVLMRGDVLNLQFGNNTFDGAITSFCIRNVTDRRRGLSEIQRALRPGSPIVILELTEPRGSIMGPLFRIYARVIMPFVTWFMSSTSAYKYLADSMADFPKPEIFMDLMMGVGFRDLNYQHLTGGIVTIFTGRA